MAVGDVLWERHRGRARFSHGCLEQALWFYCSWCLCSFSCLCFFVFLHAVADVAEATLSRLWKCSFIGLLFCFRGLFKFMRFSFGFLFVAKIAQSIRIEFCVSKCRSSVAARLAMAAPLASLPSLAAAEEWSLAYGNATGTETFEASTAISDAVNRQLSSRSFHGLLHGSGTSCQSSWAHAAKAGVIWPKVLPRSKHVCSGKSVVRMGSIRAIEPAVRRECKSGAIEPIVWMGSIRAIQLRVRMG